MHFAGNDAEIEAVHHFGKQQPMSQGFVRVHRSLIVNRRQICERRDGNALLGRSRRSVKVSRTFAACVARSSSGASFS